MFGKAFGIAQVLKCCGPGTVDGVMMSVGVQLTASSGVLVTAGISGCVRNAFPRRRSRHLGEGQRGGDRRSSCAHSGCQAPLLGLTWAGGLHASNGARPGLPIEAAFAFWLALQHGGRGWGGCKVRIVAGCERQGGTRPCDDLLGTPGRPAIGQLASWRAPYEGLAGSKER